MRRGKPAAIAGMLVAGCLFAFDVTSGNRQLMENARQRAFLINQEVVRQMGGLVEPARISLKGRIKQQPDGTWQVVIDELDTQPIAESGKFPFSEGAVAKPIEYIKFEEIPSLSRQPSQGD